MSAGKRLVTDDWILNEEEEASREDACDDVHQEKFPDSEHVAIPGFDGQGSGVIAKDVTPDPLPKTSEAPVSLGKHETWI